MLLPGIVLAVDVMVPILLAGATALAWIWWCDRPPRTTTTWVYAALAYVVTMGILPNLHGLFLFPFVYRGNFALKQAGLFIMYRPLPAVLLALTVYLLWYRFLRPRLALAA